MIRIPDAMLATAISLWGGATLAAIEATWRVGIELTEGETAWIASGRWRPSEDPARQARTVYRWVGEEIIVGRYDDTDPTVIHLMSAISLSPAERAKAFRAKGGRDMLPRIFWAYGPAEIASDRAARTGQTVRNNEQVLRLERLIPPPPGMELPEHEAPDLPERRDGWLPYLAAVRNEARAKADWCDTSMRAMAMSGRPDPARAAWLRETKRLLVALIAFLAHLIRVYGSLR